MKLIESCKRVIACEIDPRMAAEVRKRCQTGRNNLEVRESDVLKEKWPIFDVCVANLPYQPPGRAERILKEGLGAGSHEKVMGKSLRI